MIIGSTIKVEARAIYDDGKVVLTEGNNEF
jgi:hypothetical protein